MEETEEKKNKKAKKLNKANKKEENIKKQKKCDKEEKSKKKETKTKKQEKKQSKNNKPKKEIKQKDENKKQNKKKEEIEEIPENIEVFSINLATLMALFVILVIIIAIIVYLYNKPTAKISNEVDTSNLIENQTETKSPRPAAEFNVENQVSQIRGYLRYKAIATSSPKTLLETFGLVTEQKFAGYPKSSDEAFIKTDISYEAIRNEFQFYITKDFFASEYKNIYKASNGVTHVANIEKPRQDYKINKYENVDTKGRPTIQVWYTTTTDGVESEEKMMKVEFSSYNGKWLISSIK